MARLGDVCEKKVDTIKATYKGDIDYIDISSIDNQRKEITQIQSMSIVDAPSRAKQLVFPGDILVSTVRPNLNAVALVTENSDNTLVASTGYCVLRCLPNADNKYVFYFCQSPAFIEKMVSQATGASYPAVTSAIVKECTIPLPSLEEQRRIAALLDKVSDLIAKRRAQLDKLDLLVKSRFVEMFGDPVSNEKNWPMVTLGDIAEIRIGPFGSLLHQEDYITGGHALVNPSHIIEGQICIDEKLTVSDKKYDELSAYQLKIDDIVLGRRGEMGRCAVVHQEGLLCGTGSMIIRPHTQMRPYFLQNIISNPAYKKNIEDKAVGVTMMNLNVPIVSALTVPLLPVHMQEQFIDFMGRVSKSKLTIQQSLDKLETLKKALMQQYFG